MENKLGGKTKNGNLKTSEVKKDTEGDEKFKS